jgi:hypothetical protein
MNTPATPQTLQAVEFKNKILDLQERIHTAHPTMPVLLRQIHTQLKQDEELVTLLSDEDIGIIVSGLARQANTVLVEKEKSTKAAASAGLKKKLSGPNAVNLF